MEAYASFTRFCDWINDHESRADLLPAYFLVFARMYASIADRAEAGEFYNHFHMGRSLAEVNRDITIPRGSAPVLLDPIAQLYLGDFLGEHAALAALVPEFGWAAEPEVTPPPPAPSTFPGDDALLHAYAANGERAFAGDGSQLSGTNVCRFSLGPGLGAIGADVRTIACASRQTGGPLLVWYAAQGEKKPTKRAMLPHPACLVLAVSVHRGEIMCGQSDGDVLVWTRKDEDEDEGVPFSCTKFAADPAFPKRPVWVASFAPMGYLAAVGGNRGRICIWERRARTPSRVLVQAEQAASDISAVCWAHTGRQVFAALARGLACMWDLGAGAPTTPVRTFGGYLSIPVALSASREGKLALGACDGTVIVWDVDTTHLDIRWRDMARPEPVYCVAWSSQGLCATRGSDILVFAGDKAPQEFVVGGALGHLLVLPNSCLILAYCTM